MSGLPDGWRVVRLGDCTRVVGGSTPASSRAEFWEGDIGWITPTDLSALDGPNIESSARKITQAGYDSCGTELLPPGAVVMSSRAPIGYLGIARTPLCTNQGCKSFVPDPARVTPEFLYWALSHAMPGIVALGSGATFAEVSKGKLEGVELPLPPLGEQRRIVAALSERRAAVATLRVKYEQDGKELAAARARLAADVCPTTEADARERGWRWMPIADVCNLVNGNAYKDTDWSRQGTPIVRIQNLNDASKGFNYWAGPVEGRVTIERDDLLFAWSGTPGTSFGAHTWRGGLALLNQHIFRVDPRPDVTTRDWLRVALNARLPIIIEASHGGVGLRHITRRELDRIAVPVPPLADQPFEVAAFEERRNAVRTAEDTLSAQLAELAALDAALLRAAFSGAL